MARRAHIVELLKRRRALHERDKPRFHPFTRVPLTNADLIDVFPDGASEEHLNSFVSRTGVELPTSLRVWLSITNGAAGFYGIRPVDARCDLEDVWKLRPNWIKRAWIPVASDAHGNFYVQFSAPIEGGLQPVFFVEGVNDDSPLYVTASNMLHFAEFYLEGELYSRENQTETEFQWPFSPEYVLVKDPLIAGVSDLPRPWDP